MLQTIKKNWAAQVAVVFFVLFTLWWVFLKLTTEPESLHNQLFAAVYGVMALWGAIWGVNISLKWGGFKSVMGKLILMFALGLFAQEFGQLTYSYYIYFARVEVPYPSIGDLGFFGYMPLYLYGILLLGRAAGIKVSLRSFKSQIQAVFIPLAMLVFSYILFLQKYEFDWSNPLIIFLDFSYPLGQAFNVSMAILVYSLSRKILGGIMRSRILFILIAFVAQYLADFTFLYQANRGTWYAGGINDYMYFVSYFLMTLALIQLKTTADALDNREK